MSRTLLPRILTAALLLAALAVAWLNPAHPTEPEAAGGVLHRSGKVQVMVGEIISFAFGYCQPALFLVDWPGCEK
jgi:hypothetical protein